VRKLSITGRVPGPIGILGPANGQTGIAIGSAKPRPCKHHYPVFLLAALLLAVKGAPVATGQGADGRRATPEAVRLVWPPAPDDPRIAYESSFSGPEDLGMRSQRRRSVFDMIVGKPKDEHRLVKPFGIAVDRELNLCLTDTGSSAVWFFDFKRKRYKYWDTIGSIHLVSPVAVAKSGSRFYVADSQLGMVLSFKQDGELLNVISNELTRPSGLSIVGDELFVADSAAHQVFVFDLEGELLHAFGKRGSAPGEFNYPTHLAATSNRQLVVTDSMNSRVQVFDLEGNLLSVIGSLGDSSGHLSRPKGVATDSMGHVYVVDALFGNFQIFDQDGQFLLDVGQEGSQPGEFWMPSGIAIGADDRIYVVDSYNKRIQVFRFLDQP